MIADEKEFVRSEETVDEYFSRRFCVERFFGVRFKVRMPFWLVSVIVDHLVRLLFVAIARKNISNAKILKDFKNMSTLVNCIKVPEWLQGSANGHQYGLASWVMVYEIGDVVDALFECHPDAFLARRVLAYLIVAVTRKIRATATSASEDVIVFLQRLFVWFSFSSQSMRWPTKQTD